MDELESEGDKCGARGSACCPDGTCEPRAICSAASALDAGSDALSEDAGGQGTCVGCGGPLEPCCPSDSCLDKALACSTSGVCKGCGEPGQPCCVDGAVACAENLGGLSCQNDICTGCGAEGEDCCDGECGDSLTCDANQKCVRCGGPLQPCCGKLCNTANTYCHADDTCHECGTPSADCCPSGSPCGTGLSCQGTCQPCGYLGVPCCDNQLCSGDKVRCGANNMCVVCCVKCKGGINTCVDSPLNDCAQNAADFCNKQPGSPDRTWHQWSSTCGC